MTPEHKRAPPILGANGRPLKGSESPPAPIAVIRQNPLPCIAGVSLLQIRESPSKPEVKGWRFMLMLQTQVDGGGKVLTLDIGKGAHAREVAQMVAQIVEALNSAADEQERSAPANDPAQAEDPDPGREKGTSPPSPEPDQRSGPAP